MRRHTGPSKKMWGRVACLLTVHPSTGTSLPKSDQKQTLMLTVIKKAQCLDWQKAHTNKQALSSLPSLLPCIPPPPKIPEAEPAGGKKRRMALKMIIHTFAEKVHKRTGWSQKEGWVGKRRKRQVVVLVVEVGRSMGEGFLKHTRDGK